jgi:small subunit ribosomal protein S16
VSVRIRLTRAGRKKVPHYRIVVMDSRNRRDGAYLDQLGTYHPRRQPAQLTVDENKALKWLMAGARPSDTVRSLLSRQGILLQFDLMKRDTPPEVVAESVAKLKSARAERDVRRADTRASKRKAKAAAAETPSETTQSA